MANHIKFPRRVMVLSGGGNGNVDLVPVNIVSTDIGTPDVGTPFTFDTIITGTTPYTVTITAGALPAGLSVDGSTGDISGTPTGPAGPYSFNMHATNPNPSFDDQLFTGTVTDGTPPAVYSFRYGNLTYPGAPTAAPTFVATDFTGGGPLFSDYTEILADTRVSRNGTYPFPGGGSGIRQVMWISDALLAGSETFTVSGFPWGLTPAANTFLQSLTIGGVAGKVFFTADINNGSYSVVVT